MSINFHSCELTIHRDTPPYYAVTRPVCRLSRENYLIALSGTALCPPPFYYRNNPGNGIAFTRGEHHSLPLRPHATPQNVSLDWPWILTQSRKQYVGSISRFRAALALVFGLRPRAGRFRGAINSIKTTPSITPDTIWKMAGSFIFPSFRILRLQLQPPGSLVH